MRHHIISQAKAEEEHILQMDLIWKKDNTNNTEQDAEQHPEQNAAGHPEPHWKDTGEKLSDEEYWNLALEGRKQLERLEYLVNSPEWSTSGASYSMNKDMINDIKTLQGVLQGTTQEALQHAENELQANRQPEEESATSLTGRFRNILGNALGRKQESTQEVDYKGASYYQSAEEHPSLDPSPDPPRRQMEYSITGAPEPSTEYRQDPLNSHLEWQTNEPDRQTEEHYVTDIRQNLDQIMSGQLGDDEKRDVLERIETATALFKNAFNNRTEPQRTELQESPQRLAPISRPAHAGRPPSLTGWNSSPPLYGEPVTFIIISCWIPAAIGPDPRAGNSTITKPDGTGQTAYTGDTPTSHT